MEETLDDSSMASSRGPLGPAIIQTSDKRDADAGQFDSNKRYREVVGAQE